MADVPVGAVPAPDPAAAPAAVAARREAPSVARAAKLAAVTAGLAKLDAGSTAAPDAAVAAPPAAGLQAAADPAPTKPTTEPDGKVEPKPEAKDPPPADKLAEPAPDDKTTKAIAAIDRRAKQFRDEQAAERAKLDLERAELARIKSEVDGRATSIDELRKLAKIDPIALLAKLGLDSEDEWEAVGRGAYPRTKTGKADPRAAPAAAQTARERQLADQLAAVSEKQAKLEELIQSRDAQAQAKSFVDDYLDGAVKAIPTTPSLIGKLHAKSPKKAQQALLELGQAMEKRAMAADGAKKYDPSYTPSHADLIAEYEKTRRAELEEQGVDVDNLLAGAGAKPAAPATKPAATLDPTSTTGTRPINGSPTRAEKLAAVTAGLKKLDAAAT